jgi:hypothetical protein
MSTKNSTENMATGELVAQLKSLAGKAGRTLYDRLAIVTRILADRQYVSATWGEEIKALEVLEHEAFGDLCAVRSLSFLLGMFREYPERADWDRFGWNLTRLLVEYEEKLAVAKKEANAGREETAGEKPPTKSQLKARVAELEQEVAMLKARIEELEKMMDKQLNKMMK